MSSAGRAANSNGCVSKPKEHATGLIGFPPHKSDALRSLAAVPWKRPSIRSRVNREVHASDLGAARG